jgi:hypothetical protein
MDAEDVLDGIARFQVAVKEKNVVLGGAKLQAETDQQMEGDKNGNEDGN